MMFYGAKKTHIDRGLRLRLIFVFCALDTFYLRLYGVRHMVKDHSDSERGNPMPLHGLLFPISSKGWFFYMHHPTDRIIHTTTFVTPEIAQWVHYVGSIRQPIAP